MATNLDFAGKLVVITGAGRAGQLAEMLALRFAERGATLALIDRSRENVESRASDLRKNGYEVSAHAADLSSTDAVNALAGEVAVAHRLDATRGVHALVCAAGGFAMSGAVAESDPEIWHRMFTINADTAYQSTRVFLPHLRVARGSIVYFGSVASLPTGNPGGMAAYAAAKSGVISLMRSVASDERKTGVRANAVAPTAIRTAANIEDMGADKAYVDRESVADVVAFLASDAARNITGQTITLA